MLTTVGVGGRIGLFPLCEYSTPHHNRFLTREKPFHLKSPLLNPPKKYLKYNRHKHFVVM